MAGSFPFARMQSHQTSVVPLPGSRFAVFFSEHGSDGLSFGSAMLGQVNAEGLAEKKGIFRFAESAVTRLTATLLTPESFALAYRAAADPTADPLTVVRGEANVVTASWRRRIWSSILILLRSSRASRRSGIAVSVC